MVQHYQILSITHRQTSLENIGQFVIPDAEGEVLRGRLEHLKSSFGLKELFYLATCNRVMYVVYSDKILEEMFRRAFFQEVNPLINYDLIGSEIKHFQGDDALQHLLQVSASVDSMVVGEREILRQLRESYDRCAEWKLTGDNLRLMFRLAIESGKEVYAQTKIGEKPVSIVSLAIQKLRQAHLPKDARIVMVGAGQTNRLVAKFLKKMSFPNITIFNRTLAKAKQVASIMDAEAHPLSNLPKYTGGFDCLIVCTGSTKSIISSELYQHLLQGDTEEKLVIDLSIPYNVNEDVVKNFPVKYIEIEGLKALAHENHNFRKLEITKANKLIDQQLLKFKETYQHRQIARAMSRVPAEIKAVKQKALNEVFQDDLANLDADTRQLFETMMDYMEKKCIGIPMRAAKEAVL
ncbi:MAG: glutamyl-tRNA reductase [Saprospiraceae bacterium]|jgi:glutamyl-tRNA reductase